MGEEVQFLRASPAFFGEASTSRKLDCGESEPIARVVRIAAQQEAMAAAIQRYRREAFVLSP
jgi:hypothetical protein